MASPRTIRVLKELRFKDDNNICFECGEHSPQWVSVSYGIWFCLACSGKHRGLGVHLSFVRSATMDKWKDTELAKMKVGGNKKAREFFKSQPDYNPSWTLQEKYNSKAAALYRDKISTEAQGKSWSIETSSARNYTPHVIRTFVDSGASMKSSSSPSFGSAHSSMSGGSAGYQGTGLSYDDVSRQKADFFARRQAENAERPNNLPPSQGGKYSGFGSSPAPTAKANDDMFEGAMSSLSSGWASFTLGASKFASVASEKASKLAATATEKSKELTKNVKVKVKDGTLLNDVGSSMSQFANKVGAASSKGWKNISATFNDGEHSRERESLTSNTQQGTFGNTNTQFGSSAEPDWSDWNYTDDPGSITTDTHVTSQQGDWTDAWSEPTSKKPEANDGWDTTDWGDTSSKSKPKQKKEKKRTTKSKGPEVGQLIDFGAEDDSWNSTDWGTTKPVESDCKSDVKPSWDTGKWTAEEDNVWQSLEDDKLK